MAMACRSQECFQLVDLWNHLCHLTTFASQVAGCLSTMCAYNLVNGATAKIEQNGLQDASSEVFFFGGGDFTNYSKCVGRQEMRKKTCKKHVICRRLIKATKPSQEFMPVQMKRLDSNRTLLSEWEERLSKCSTWMSVQCRHSSMMKAFKL